MSLAYRPDVDGLRAIAVGSVVLFHASFSLFKGGFVGVDVFFVISGYLITSIIAGDMAVGRFSLADFYDRRVRRILPALYVVIAATTIAATFFLLPNQMREFAQSLGPAALFYANIHFMGMQSYFAPAAEDLPLLHLWSLAVEEQFYIFFPVILYLLMRYFGRRTAIGVLLVVAVASLVWAQVELQDEPRRAFYLLTSRAWELLIGSFLAIVSLPRVPARVAAGLGILGLAAILVPVFFYSRLTPFPGIAALPPVLGAALLIYSGQHAPRAPVAWLLSTAPFVYVGRISYSLYLWHWPLFSMAFVYRGRGPTTLLALILIAVAVLLSALMLKYVETPLRRPDTLGGRRTARFAAAAAVIALTILAGRTLTAVDGQLWPMTTRGLLAEAAMEEPHFPRTCPGGEDFMPGALSCFMPPAAGGRYDVLVWGDSHARASYIAFVEMLASKGVSSRLLSLPGCPPLAGVTTPRTSKTGPRCNAFNARVMEEIARDQPKLVILIGRWSMWTTHAQRDMAIVINDLPEAQQPSRAGSRAAFPYALRQTVEGIRKAGPNVLVLGQAPEYNPPPARCVARAEYFGGDSSACVKQTAEKMERVLAYSNEQVLKVASQIPGTKGVLLTPIFCGAAECAAARPDAFFYRDGDHVTDAGARMLRDDPALRAAVFDLLDTPARPIHARN